MKFSNLSYTGILFLLFSGISFTSCEKLLQIPPAVNQITKEQLFSDSGTIASNMTGLYSSGLLATEVSVYPVLMQGLAGDEIILTNPGIIWNTFYTNNYTPVTSHFIGLWGQPYAAIYHANGFIDNLPASTAISEELKKQYVAEAKFMRAFQYLTLTGLFGDVPLVLNTNVGANSSLPRAPRAAITEQMIKDLSEAIPDLRNRSDMTRATPYAAYALLARIYLYQKKWALASDMASKAMAGPFSLETDLLKTFLRGSKEGILKASSQAGGGGYTDYTRWAALLAPGTSTRVAPNFIMQPGLVAAFETGDKRKTSWTTTRTVNGKVYTCGYKYRLKSYSPSSQEDFIYLRLPEQMLIKAEALAELNQPDEARELVDSVRTRAGLDKLPVSATKDEIITALRKERRTELFMEGERWPYLYHTGKLDEVMTPLKSNWKPKYKLFPVPQTERINNPNLSQNDDY
ncbi:MAG: RagB/SusD family nutrient uptake outer membrane protein [Pseudobacter sp.]|uniref:RagB/SusD family nutrient uptake outer membrane protein n=1 Tax=Pseudobacter sp. TaxID=2045420 RepID=UPI003F800D57